MTNPNPNLFSWSIPYSMTDTARCTKHNRWCLHFKSCEATKQSRGGVRSVGLLTICNSNDIRVGTFLNSSSLTVSQLKCFTASTESRKTESCESELKVFHLLFYCESQLTYHWLWHQLRIDNTWCHGDIRFSGELFYRHFTRRGSSSTLVRYDNLKYIMRINFW